MECKQSKSGEWVICEQVESPAPVPAEVVAAQAEIAAIEPMTPRQFVDSYTCNTLRHRGFSEIEKDDLAAAIDTYFVPRIPMADEGQRGYTEAEVQEMLGNERERVVKEKDARIAELERALEPFAACAPHIPSTQGGEYSLWWKRSGTVDVHIFASDVLNAARVRGEKCQ